MMYPGLAENQWYGQPKKVDLVTHLKYQGAIDSRKCQTSVGKGGKLVVGRFDDLLRMALGRWLTRVCLATTLASRVVPMMLRKRSLFSTRILMALSLQLKIANNIFYDLGTETKEQDTGNIISIF